MNQIIESIKSIHTFDEIYEHTEDLSKKEKGDLFEIITYHLFRLNPVLKYNVKNIWMYTDVPNDIRTYLNLPVKDKGIDILIQMKDLSFRAVQCKFRQNPYVAINWNELSTFFGLSFGMNDKIQGGYLVTNTYNMCDKVNASAKVKTIDGSFLDSNISQDFSRICARCIVLNEK